jgi:hypothetical protein
MSKPTLAQVRGQFETDLADSDLQTVIDAEDHEVVSRYGPHASEVDELEGGHTHLFLSRRVATVTSIVETVGDTDTALAADDYEIRHDGWALERLNTGTNQRERWGRVNLVTYVPKSDPRRVQVVIDLVKLTLQFRGLSVERAGDYRADLGDYQQTRDMILRTLASERKVAA